MRGTFLCCILHYGPMLSAVFGVRSPGAWLARGQKLGLCLCPIVFLHGEATIRSTAAIARSTNVLSLLQ